MDAEQFTYFCGAASGSGRKALRHLEESDVMISYGTAHNRPWEGIEQLFTDNGAYSLANEKGVYETPARDYSLYVSEVGSELYCWRDLLATPDTVALAQQRTTELHRECAALHQEHGLSAEPVCVLQGWEPEDYISHLEELREAGLLTNYVAIGSLKRNSTGENRPEVRTSTVETLREIILGVRAELPSKHRIHALGATLGDPSGSTPGVLQYPAVRNAIDSTDTQSYEYNRTEVFPETWRNVVAAYVREARKLRSLSSTEQPAETEQTQLPV